MSEWVCIVRLDSEDDPGAELVQVLRERYGSRVRTLTKLASLYDLERQPIAPYRVSPAQVAEHESHRLKRRYGK